MLNKTEYIKGVLTMNPEMPVSEIAFKAKCTPQMVNYVKRNLVEVKDDAKVVGVVADTHVPFDQPGYLEFCVRTFARYKVDTVVHIGDLVDNHAASRFQSETNAMNVEDELIATRKALQPWFKAFPKAKLCLGNHDRIPVRQAKAQGLPASYMKTFEELYGLPEGWDCAMVHNIDGVHYDHGLGSGGMYGARNTALKMCGSYVQGHTHLHSGVHYMSKPDGTSFFGMNVGCGVDGSSYAQNYAKGMRGEFTIGCGIVINGKEAVFVPMT